MNATRLSVTLCLLAAMTTPTWAAAINIPTQPVDQALRAKLPEEIKTAGEIVAVNSGSFPPYEIVLNATTVQGASADIAQAVAEMLGVKLRHETASGLAAQLTGVKGGRYQFATGPIGDFPDREAANDFVDFVQEFVVFAVHAGNPEGINSLDDTCGKRIAVMAAGSAERVIKKQSDDCKAAGKKAIEVQSYNDQPTSILAVRSNRADAFFSSQAPLTYFVQQAHGALELTGVGNHNGFQDLYQGSVVGKDTPFRDILLAAYQKLFDNGTYALIMKKWDLENNMLKAPGIDLATRAGK